MSDDTRTVREILETAQKEARRLGVAGDSAGQDMVGLAASRGARFMLLNEAIVTVLAALEPMERDHEAMEKWRATPGTVTYGLKEGGIWGWRYEPNGYFRNPVATDPTDAILGGAKP